jgi:hypothetical protein
MANWDDELPKPGVVFDAARWTFSSYLIDRIERAAPSRIVCTSSGRRSGSDGWLVD